MGGISGTVREVRGTMREEGQDDGGHGVVLRSCPDPVPCGEDFAFPQDLVDRSRYRGEGCPFRNADADRAHDSAAPRRPTGPSRRAIGRSRPRVAGTAAGVRSPV